MKHEEMLAVVFVVWCVLGVLAGVIAFRRAPAVAMALFGWVLGGVAGLVIGSRTTHHGVPETVALGSSIGLVTFGAPGLALLRPRPPARTLKLAAGWLALAAPFAVAATVFALLFACPMYVRGGYCHYDVDLLGGWMSSVGFLLAIDAIALVTALLWSTRQARRREDAQTAPPPPIVVASNPSA
jgi:hypothetical protein